MDESASEPKASDDGDDARPVASKRIAIFIVAYNAASTLRSVLDRIPKEIWEKVEEVFVFDDSSGDDTYLVGLGYKALYGRAKLTVIRNRDNQGYGGNQILGYQYAIERGYDIVALLHGDGQYAPELLPELLRPLEEGRADAVFGSRMLERGLARKGGMPLYKYWGNRVLTAFENTMLGMSLSEFHSGYRLYSLAALRDIPFEKNTNEFHFDTQIIIQLNAAGKRILEVPIPTYYGDEICYVNGMKYARDVVRSVLEYQLHALALRPAPEYRIRAPYTFKRTPLSSHAQIINLVGPSSFRVLDIGCGEGELAHELRRRGHHVTGVDQHLPRFELDRFVQADLSEGLPSLADGGFEVVLLADVLEHMARPDALLAQAVGVLAKGGRMVVSLPNAVHWSMRAQVLSGRFDYTNKGITDETHLRFFTRASAQRLLESAGLQVVTHRTTPVPWCNVFSGALGGVPERSLERADHLGARLLPNLFAYQHVFELKRAGE